VKLFGKEHVVGVFRGFSDSGMEFHADLVLPYREELQSIPMHGQFVLVQLEHENEAVLGRITSVAAEGRLVSPIGEDYAIRAVRDDRPIPDELRDQYLKYRVDIRVLGVERLAGDKLIFVPSHRRLPHVGAKVALCSPEVLRAVANASAAASAASPLPTGLTPSTCHRPLAWSRKKPTVMQTLPSAASNASSAASGTSTLMVSSAMALARIRLAPDEMPAPW